MNDEWNIKPYLGVLPRVLSALQEIKPYKLVIAVYTQVEVSLPSMNTHQSDK